MYSTDDAMNDDDYTSPFVLDDVTLPIVREGVGKTLSSLYAQPYRLTVSKNSEPDYDGAYADLNNPWVSYDTQFDSDMLENSRKYIQALADAKLIDVVLGAVHTQEVARQQRQIEIDRLKEEIKDRQIKLAELERLNAETKQADRRIDLVL